MSWIEQEQRGLSARLRSFDFSECSRQQRVIEFLSKGKKLKEYFLRRVHLAMHEFEFMRERKDGQT